MSTEAVVTAQGLVKKYDWLTAVDDISFEIDQGEVFGLLGPNGAGKTTTARMICSLIPPTSGKATVLGMDVASQQIGVKASIGLLPETPSVYESLSAQENLEFFCEMYRVPKQERSTRIDELLSAFGLEGRRSSKVETFSRGMKQKLALARTLVHDPSVIFLDEPTSGLDPESAKMVRDRIAYMSNEADKTVFMCTHNLVEAESLCSRVAIIKSGKIVRMGSPDEMQMGSSGLAAYTVLLDRMPEDLARTLQGLDYVHGVATIDSGLQIQLAGSDQRAPDLLEAIIRSGGRVKEFRRDARTLEDIYLEAVRA